MPAMGRESRISSFQVLDVGSRRVCLCVCGCVGVVMCFYYLVIRTFFPHLQVDHHEKSRYSEIRSRLTIRTPEIEGQKALAPLPPSQQTSRPVSADRHSQATLHQPSYASRQAEIPRKSGGDNEMDGWMNGWIGGRRTVGLGSGLTD